MASAVGAMWCAQYAWPIVNPFSVDMVLRGDDWSKDTLGWLFFRNEPWALPLGRLKGFLHPLGTTLGLMDSIPWVALVLRTVSSLLPYDFQYLGAWVLICSASLGFVVARLASRLTPHWEQQALAGSLAAIAPVLVPRIGHAALCAHALIVLAIGLNVRGRSPSTAHYQLVRGNLLVWLTAATHPYLTVMVLAIATGVPWQVRRQTGPLVACCGLATMWLGTWGTFKLLGYLNPDFIGAVGGFGEYSANLNTLINSMGRSRLFDPLPTVGPQYEGYGYLGAGIFFVIGVALLCFVLPNTRRRLRELPWRRALWPLAAAIGCAVLAFATPVRWGTVEVARIDIFRHIASVTHTFRSSGRFIWPLVYCIVLGASFVVVQALRDTRWLLTVVLTFGVGLQAYDLNYADVFVRYQLPPLRRLTAPAWSMSDRAFKHLVLLPAEINGVCDGSKGYAFVLELAYLAYRHHWTFNSGYAGRYHKATHDYCSELLRNAKAAALEADTLYVVSEKQASALQRRGATCGVIDRVLVCVSKEAAAPALTTFLRVHGR